MKLIASRNELYYILTCTLYFLVFFYVRDDSFRKEFSCLEEKRSIVPESVHLMTLTATAILSTRKFIIKNLCMDNPAIVYIPPVKNNIIYFASDKPKAGIQAAFQPVTSRLLRERDMGRVIIFCRLYPDAIAIHSCFLHALGESCTEPRGSLTILSIEYLTCTHTAHTHL